MSRIGFIGLGNMGLPMAQNLLKAGHQVEGVDVNPAAIEKLKAAGGASVEAAKGAAARADVVITMLPSSVEVEATVLGADGVLANSRPGQLVMDMSTVEPQTTDLLVAAAAARGVSVVDHAIAVLSNDYVADNQFIGLKVETTGGGPPGVAPSTQAYGVALVCNRNVGVSGACTYQHELSMRTLREPRELNGKNARAR